MTDLDLKRDIHGQVTAKIAGDIVGHWVARDNVFNTDKISDLVVELGLKIRDKAKEKKLFGG